MGGIWEPEAAEQPHLEFESWETAALKGHGFIRAARTRKIGGLEPLRDGFCRLQTIPRVLKHISFLANFSGTDKSVPFQNNPSPFFQMRLPCRKWDFPATVRAPQTAVLRWQAQDLWRVQREKVLRGGRLIVAEKSPGTPTLQTCLPATLPRVPRQWQSRDGSWRRGAVRARRARSPPSLYARPWHRQRGAR